MIAKAWDIIHTTKWEDDEEKNGKTIGKKKIRVGILRSLVEMTFWVTARGCHKVDV